MRQAKSASRWLGGHFRARVMAGIFVVVPALITFFILRFLFVEIEGLLQPVAQRLMGRAIPGAGFVITLALLYVVGTIAANFVGRRIIETGHRLMSRIPVVEPIYTASKGVMDAFAGSGKVAFRRVVAIEYPRKGIWTVGFVTGQLTNPDGTPYLAVYIPTTPNPTSGFLALVTESEIADTNLTVEQAMKMVISGGIISPSAFQPQQKPLPMNDADPRGKAEEQPIYVRPQGLS